MREDMEREVWEDGKWQKVEDYQKLSKVEGQVWIAIYNLLMTKESAEKYEITEYRKNQILRLRKYLNEVLLDQIPVLTELKRNLEHLSILNTS